MVSLLINLEDIKAEDWQRLRTLAARAVSRGRKRWMAGCRYSLDSENTVKLSHDLVCRFSKSKPGQLRYDVVEQATLGQGKGAVTIRNILSTLYLDEKRQRARLDIEKQRVVKTYLGKKPYHHFRRMLEEYRLSHLFSYLKMKEPVLDTSTTPSCSFIMKRMPGCDLHDLIFSKGVILSVKQRIKLCLELALALQRQVITPGLVHLDIKPENIMVNLSTWTVNMVDFESAKLKSTKNGEWFGTHVYCAPERFVDAAVVEQPADIFSLGRVFAIIWGVDLEKCHYHKKVAWGYSSPTDILQGLFKGLSLRHVWKKHIQHLLYGMLLKEPTSRWCIDDVIACFSALATIDDRPLAPHTLPLAPSFAGCGVGVTVDGQPGAGSSQDTSLEASSSDHLLLLRVLVIQTAHYEKGQRGAIEYLPIIINSMLSDNSKIKDNSFQIIKNLLKNSQKSVNNACRKAMVSNEAFFNRLIIEGLDPDADRDVLPLMHNVINTPKAIGMMKLKRDLLAYIIRVRDFGQRNACFFAGRKLANQKINYVLAERFLRELCSGKAPGAVFANPLVMRASIRDCSHVKPAGNCIRSSELNAIIEQGKRMSPSEPIFSPRPGC